MTATVTATAKPFTSLVTQAAQSPKLSKAGEFEGVEIVAAVLYLAPANLSGYEVCNGRTKGCTAGCLNSAGRGGIGATFDENGMLIKANTVQSCRIRRTVMFFEQREAFMALLVKDIERLIKKAAKRGGLPAFRPNGTSDLDWTVIPCARKGRHFANIFEAFPEVRFWDYTKVKSRMMAFLRGELPANYDLTFSRAETMANQIAAMEVLQAGGNVAAVFGVKKGGLPSTWNGHEVLNGDTNDFRFADAKGGKIVGLIAKAKAKRDASGFVIRLNVPALVRGGYAIAA